MKMQKSTLETLNTLFKMDESAFQVIIILIYCGIFLPIFFVCLYSESCCKSKRKKISKIIKEQEMEKLIKKNQNSQMKELKSKNLSDTQKSEKNLKDLISRRFKEYNNLFIILVLFFLLNTFCFCTSSEISVFLYYILLLVQIFYCFLLQLTQDYFNFRKFYEQRIYTFWMSIFLLISPFLYQVSIYFDSIFYNYKSFLLQFLTYSFFFYICKEYLTKIQSKLFSLKLEPYDTLLRNTQIIQRIGKFILLIGLICFMIIPFIYDLISTPRISFMSSPFLDFLGVMYSIGNISYLAVRLFQKFTDQVYRFLSSKKKNNQFNNQ